MYIHIGSNINVAINDVIVILDYLKSDSEINKELLDVFYNKKKVINVSEGDIRSIILVESLNDSFLYLSHISSQTLKKRYLTLCNVMSNRSKA